MKNVFFTTILFSFYFLIFPKWVIGQIVLFEPQVNYDVGSGAYGMAASDLDNDGDLDLTIAGRYMDSISVLLNNGDGTYANYMAYPAGNEPIDITSIDINGDEYQDIAVSNYLSDNISLYLNNGDGTFFLHLNLEGIDGPVGIVSADFDADGDQDLATANEAASTMAVFLNNGDSTFAASVSYEAGTETFRIATSDVDGDGYLDIAVSNRQSDNISVFLNNGDGSFDSQIIYNAGDAPYGITFADINGDNNNDIIVTNVSIDSISVFINNGDGTFATRVTYQTCSNPYSIAADDFDSDGNIDLAVANRYSGNVSFLKNNGDGTFAEQDTFRVGIYPYTIISGDINGDGNSDIATANGNSTDVSILLNSRMEVQINTLPIVDSFDTDDSSWTEFDSGSKIELDYTTDQRLEFENWIRYEEGFVSQAITPTTNFIFDYDFNITADWGNANSVGPAFSDTYGTLSDAQSGNGIYLIYYAGTGSKMYLYTVENGTSTNNYNSGGNSVSIIVGQTYYATFEKDGDTLTYSLYSNSSRTTHISGSPISITTSGFSDISFDNFYAVNGWAAIDTVNNPEWTSGWIDNINLREEIQDNLIAYYPFNGNANDESGNGYDGIVNGASLVVDRFGNSNSAYSFDGIDDFIETLDHSDFNFGTGNFSIVAWGLTTSNSAGRIVAKANHDLDDGYQLGITTVGRFYLLDSEPVVNSTDSLTDGNWHQIVGIRDGDELKMYIDGVLDNSIAGVLNWDVNTNHTLKIGRRDGSQPAYFNGLIDDIRIYNRALTEPEIQELFHEDGWQQENIALSVPELSVSVNDTILVPINVQFTGSASYTSAEITISGYQNSLDFVAMVSDSSLTGDAGWTYAVNETDSLLITWSAGAQDISGSGVLCWLKFVVNGDGCTFVPVNIELAAFNTGINSIVITNGGVNIEAIPDFGDADANGNLQAYDASTILKHLVGLDSLTCQGLANAEVSCNDTITAYDASLILQKGVGLIDSLPWCEPILASYYSINLTSSLSKINPGETFTISVDVESGTDIYSHQGVLDYTEDLVTFDYVIWPDGISGDSINDSTDGEIKFARASRGYNQDYSGSLIEFHFTARTTIDANAGFDLTAFRLNESSMLERSMEVVLGIGDEAGLPNTFVLYQNYPNPFNPVTTLRYDLPGQALVKLIIYDVLGREVRSLVNQMQEPGFKSVQWDARDDFGRPVGAGVYLYRIEAGGNSTNLRFGKQASSEHRFVQTNKMILLK